MSSGVLVNRIWRITERIGLAPVLRKIYFIGHVIPRRWRYRAHVEGVTAEFKISGWYELKRAKNFHGERRVLESFVSTLEPDDVVWDVGANVGLYSCFAARRLSTGTVVGFEPVAVNRDRLIENLRMNAPEDRWRTEDSALWSANESVSLAFCHPESNRSIAGAGHHYLTDGDGWTTVDCRRGDDLVRDGVPAPDVMKIDVQGAELDVLVGMGTVLEEVDKIYLEIHREKSKRYYTCPSEIEAFLRDQGFTLAHFGDPDSFRGGVYHVFAHRSNATTGETPRTADASK